MVRQIKPWLFIWGSKLLGNYENAIEYAIESVLKPGEDDKKINLFFGYG